MSLASCTSLCFVLGLLSTILPGSSQQQGLTITPSSQNEGRFEGQEFHRGCRTTSLISGVQYEWLRDGVVVRTGSDNTLTLDIASVSLNDTGTYACRATLSNGTVLGPMNAGTLTVAATRFITAPENQYVIHGRNSVLNCSYNSTVGNVASVEKDDAVVTNSQITNANLDDEGEYVCDIFLFDSQAAIEVPFMVHVIVPITITSHPPGHTPIEGNPPVSLMVDFTGRREQNIMVTWYKDGSPLPPRLQSSVVTTYDDFRLTGRTSLNVTSVQRRDSGVYRVVLESQLGAGVLPRDVLYEEISFQMDVTVPPAMPGNFMIERNSITSVFARVSWSLTNQTADEGADVLTLRLTYRNMSFIDDIRLSGDATSVPLNLIPGTEYAVRLMAENPDGMVTTETMYFQTLLGTPKVNELSVSHIRNSLSFEVSASLAYTGGGNISFFKISYRLSTSDAFVQIGNVRATSDSNNGLVWTGNFDVDLVDVQSRNIQFFVVVMNQYNFKSNGTISEAVIELTTTQSTGTPMTTAGDVDLPMMYLIIGAASAFVLLVVIMGVIICFCVVCYCRRKNRQQNKYNINKGNSNVSVESGNGNQYVEHQVPSPSSSIPKYPHPQAFFMNGSIPTGSAPSIKTSSSSPTPQPDDHDSLLMHKTNNYINHQKTNSDASSIFTKRGNTPSTTASSSPAPAIMKAIYEEQLRTESRMREDGRSSFSTSISEEIRNFIPQGGQEMEMQNSQTESENVHTQMQNEHTYRPPSHMSQGSQGSNIPLYCVGKSTSNISVPSSVQSSHPSLDNRGPYQFNFTNHLSCHQGVRAGAPRAESICSYSTTGGESISEHGSRTQLQTYV